MRGRISRANSENAFPLKLNIIKQVSAKSLYCMQRLRRHAVGVTDVYPSRARVVVERQMACDLSPDANRWKISVVVQNGRINVTASRCIGFLWWIKRPLAYAAHESPCTFRSLTVMGVHSFLSIASVKYFPLSNNSFLF